MSERLTEGRARRISDDIQLVFMGRSIERFFGPEAIDVLVEHRNRKTRESWKRRARNCGRQGPGNLLCLFDHDAHEFEIIRNDERRLEVVVTRCVHAETFKQYNAVDLGERLICSGDQAVVEGNNRDMVFRRPTTCMTGNRCHFIFSLDAPAATE